MIADTEMQEWGMNMNEDLMVAEDELSATSNEEANKVFAQWKADDELMEIDEQMGSNFTLLDGSLFDDNCLSPTGPLDEFMNVEAFDGEKFMLPSLDGNHMPSTLQPKPTAQNKEVEDQYHASLRKLAESMRRSQETRRSLTLKTPKTKKYARSKDVTGVLNSVEQSSRQLQQLYLPRNM